MAYAYAKTPNPSAAQRSRHDDDVGGHQLEFDSDE
jgi:hypothetical protein